MTREEAIKELKIRFVGEYDRQREAKDMAIEALELKSCDDCVSREAVLEILSNYGCTNREGLLFKDIQALPPVTSTRKKGKWIEVNTNMYTCSNCSHCFTIVPEDNQIQQFNFCPNCG